MSRAHLDAVRAVLARDRLADLGQPRCCGRGRHALDLLAADVAAGVRGRRAAVATADDTAVVGEVERIVGDDLAEKTRGAREPLAELREAARDLPTECLRRGADVELLVRLRGLRSDGRRGVVGNGGDLRFLSGHCWGFNLRFQRGFSKCLR